MCFALGLGSEAMFPEVHRDQALQLDALKKGRGTSSVSLLTIAPALLSLSGCTSSRLPGRGMDRALFCPEGRCGHGLLG